jgi:hypothetical protein
VRLHFDETANMNLVIGRRSGRGKHSWFIFQRSRFKSQPRNPLPWCTRFLFTSVLRKFRLLSCKRRWSHPCNKPWRPIGLWDVEAPTFCRQSARRWRWSCHFFFQFLGVGWDWVHLVHRPLTDRLYQPWMIDECVAVGGMRISRGNQILPAPMLLCPQKILHDLTWAWTRAATAGRQRVTDWAMTLPRLSALRAGRTFTPRKVPGSHLC